MAEIPTPEQIQYATGRLLERRALALTLLATGDHRDDIAAMVCEYADETTPDQIAWRILNYLAERIVEPLMHENPNQGRGADLDRAEGEGAPRSVADAGIDGSHDGSDGRVGQDHAGAASEPKPATDGARASDPPGATPEEGA